MNPLRTGFELRWSGMVSSSCSTSGTRRVNLVTNPVISHEWGKDQEVFRTSGTYPWLQTIKQFYWFWEYSVLNMYNKKNFEAAKYFMKPLDWFLYNFIVAVCYQHQASFTKTSDTKWRGHEQDYTYKWWRNTFRRLCYRHKYWTNNFSKQHGIRKILTTKNELGCMMKQIILKLCNICICTSLLGGI